MEQIKTFWKMEAQQVKTTFLQGVAMIVPYCLGGLAFILASLLERASKKVLGTSSVGAIFSFALHKLVFMLDQLIESAVEAEKA